VHCGTGTKLVEATHDPSVRIVSSRAQMHDYGSAYYNNAAAADVTGIGDRNGSAPMFAYHFADCWRSFFTPSPALADRIRTEMNRMRLSPSMGYGAVHLRANYALGGKGRDRGFGSVGQGEREPALVEEWAKNALNCLSNLQRTVQEGRDRPFYFASDSSYAKQVALQYGRERNARVVTSQSQRQPLHIDVVPDWQSRDLSDYFDIFVDLYIMSMGHCMTFNVGGFGKFALQLSGRHRSQCTMVHRTLGVPKAKSHLCEWKADSTVDEDAAVHENDLKRDQAGSSTTAWNTLSAEELFLPPIMF